MTERIPRLARGLAVLLLVTTLASCGSVRATAQQPAGTPTAAATTNPTAAPAPTNPPAPTSAPAATTAPLAASASPTAGQTTLLAATTASGSAQAATATTSTAPAAVGGDAPMTQNLVSQIGKKATPGIVQITNEQMVLQQSGQQLVPAGAGTGFVIDGQGHILTNNHVVAQAQRLVVETTDGKTFPAKLIGRDPRTDLAVIQVENQTLPALPLGDSGKLVIGQWVVAIGNALALEGGPTLTVGVVSAVGRTVQEPGNQPGQPGPYLFDLVQTDAAINPGNSGGPLLNLSGEVIGINTLGSAQAQGISFAIAINTAKRIADDLIKSGKVDYAFMGVSVTPNTPSLAARFSLPQAPGLAVTDVGPNTPAAKAGIQAKDVLTAVDGQPLKAESDLSRMLAQRKPGDLVTVSVARGSGKQDVKVTLGTAAAAGG